MTHLQQRRSCRRGYVGFTAQWLFLVVLVGCWLSSVVVFVDAFYAQLVRPWELEQATRSLDPATVRKDDINVIDVLVRQRRRKRWNERRRLRHQIKRNDRSLLSQSPTLTLTSRITSTTTSSYSATKYARITTYLSAQSNDDDEPDEEMDNTDLPSPKKDTNDTDDNNQSSYTTTKGSPSILDSPTTKPPSSFLDSLLHRPAPKVNGASYEAAPNVRNSLKVLWSMTRPSNFPGVILFHVIGISLVVPSNQFRSILLGQPKIWLTLACLVLTSASSMVINDYYDATLGRDSATVIKSSQKPLVTGELPLYVARRFLVYLYAIALLLMTLLPGIPTRLSVVIGLLLTYGYTKHIKPITWLKNIVCASLIALSPLTSGSAALHLLPINTSTATTSRWSPWLGLIPLGRLVGTLFFGVFAREMMMDCNDVESDRLGNVQTVPSVYGNSFASKVIFMSSLMTAVCAFAGPLTELVTRPAVTSLVSAGTIRRLLLASIGSLMVVSRSWQVLRTDALDRKLIDRAVAEGLVTVLFFLGSFV